MSKTAGGGEELVFNPEPAGPTYDMVMSQKSALEDRQDPHWTGQLLPPAHSRSDERAHEFWSGESVLDR